MAGEGPIAKQPKGLNVFEKYLTIWVLLCIVGGIVLGKLALVAGYFSRKWIILRVK